MSGQTGISDLTFSCRMFIHKAYQFCRRLRLIVISIMTVAMLMLANQAAIAQETTSAPPMKIGVVDINSVMGQSTAMIKIRAVIDEENQKFQKTIEAEQTELRAAEEDLNNKRSVLDEEEFNRRLKAFENRVIVLQQKVQRQRQGFDVALKEANDQIRQLLLKIISEIATEEGYALVMQKQNVVLFETEIDMSPEALSRLNERTKDMKITFSNKDN
ncbi:MAG: OmpH family outer membrane protein [Candidatus Puniceispirillales bacterium]|nr:OmpH family outer membrane protein [Alphaproteobacteria bacterium]